MNKLRLLFLFVFCFTSIHAQHNFILNSDYYTSISKVVHDPDGNLYAVGSYKGNCQFGSLTKNSAHGMKFVAKLNANGNFDWVRDFNDYIWDIVVVDSVVKILHKERLKDPLHKSENLSLHIEELNSNNGERIRKMKVAELDGEYFQISLKGFFGHDGTLATAATWKRDKITSFNGKTLSKKHYSGALINYFGADGKELWRYTFSGGIDGFTNINIQTMHVGNNGNVYLVSQFGKELEFGENMLSTAVSVEEKGYMTLYNDALVMLDLKDGELNKYTRLGDYDIHIDHIASDSENNIYLTGDYSGDENYEKSGLETGYYKNALLNGQKLPSTPINPGIQQPSEGAFITSLSPDLKTRWVKTFSGQAYVGPRSLSVGNAVYLTLTYMHKISIDGEEVMAHADNNSKSDCVLIEYDLSGKKENVQYYSGADNDWIYAQAFQNELVLFGIVHDTIQVRGAEVKAENSKHGVGFINSSIKPNID